MVKIPDMETRIAIYFGWLFILIIRVIALQETEYSMSTVSKVMYYTFVGAVLIEALLYLYSVIKSFF